MEVIYIGGYGRSGSTLLDILLSNSPSVRGLGEASNLISKLSAGDACSCGLPLTSCPEWHPLSRMPREKQGIALREQVRCESFLGIIPWTIGANKAYIATWKTFFDWAEKKYDLLVDSSKITSRTVLRPFLYKKLGYDVLIIYLYKDPMDLLRSLAKGSNRSLESEGTRKGLPHLLILRSFLGAVFSYLATQFVARALKLPMQKVKYDSLVSDPGGVVKYFTGNHVEVDRTTELNSGHMVAGNRMARSPGGIFINPAANETGDIVVPGAYKYIFGFLDKIHRRARDRDFC